MAAARKAATRPGGKSARDKERLVARTPWAEWTAAGLGLVLTLAILGFTLWEAVNGGRSVPALSIKADPPAAAGAGFVVPVTLQNDSDATAASVWISGALERDGEAVETRRAMFDYVPGKGEVRGGLVFQGDPATHQLRLTIEGYQEP